MNILITGASGFIGENFLQLINREKFFAGDNIILLSSKNISGFSCILHKNYTFEKSDFIKAGIDNIDIVFHFGSATPHTTNEYYDLEYTYKYVASIRNTNYLVENLPNNPQKFIFISSTAVYRNNAGSMLSITELSPVPDQNMYAYSKVMCEKYLEKQAKERNFILQILRLGQIYGPGEEVYSKIVGGFMRRILNREQINIYGDGSDMRSLLYIEDCCRCIIEAVAFNEYLGPINIASSQKISIKELAELIYFVCDLEKNIVYENKPSGINKVFNTGKMKKYFNFTETNLVDGIKKFYNYYANKKTEGEKYARTL
jgi:UDP-glucose 4-epimerase